MDKVYRKGEVEDEFRACDQQENENNTVERLGIMRLSMMILGAYQVMLFNTQTRPSVHPTVVSPRKLRQLNKRSVFISLPKTSAVNRIRTPAHA